MIIFEYGARRRIFYSSELLFFFFSLSFWLPLLWYGVWCIQWPLILLTTFQCLVDHCLLFILFFYIFFILFFVFSFPLTLFVYLRYPGSKWFQLLSYTDIQTKKRERELEKVKWVSYLSIEMTLGSDCAESIIFQCL